MFGLADYLLLTIALELPVYLSFHRKNFFLLTGFVILLNGLTLPLANLAFHKLEINWYLMEILVAVTEGCIWALFWEKKIWLGILTGFCANAFSAFVGPWIRTWLE